ncbi:hypothetical protein [Streptomyces sp. NBC_01262]|uniref:hypothetical protein n=1 Tax=Streptomyces sp. NBC_01262 TaxID=2903803 RepID=UPI002E37B7FE|nr:hypothetical protein [Streptomyces sp. NBC_01262]
MAAWALACDWRGMDIGYGLYGTAVVTGPGRDDGGSDALADDLAEQVRAVCAAVREVLARSWSTSACPSSPIPHPRQQQENSALHPIRLISFVHLHLPATPDCTPIPPTADRIEDVRERLRGPPAARDILDLDGPRPGGRPQHARSP